MNFYNDTQLKMSTFSGADFANMYQKKNRARLNNIYYIAKKIRSAQKHHRRYKK